MAKIGEEAAHGTTLQGVAANIRENSEWSVSGIPAQLLTNGVR
jgi:hypothetical protein